MTLQTGGLPSFAGLHYLIFSQAPQKSKLKRKLGCSMIVRFELILRNLCTFHFALNLDMLGSDDQLGHMHVVQRCQESSCSPTDMVQEILTGVSLDSL